LGMLQASGVASTSASCTESSRQLQGPLAKMRGGGGADALEAGQALAAIEALLAGTPASITGAALRPGGAEADCAAAANAAQAQLESLENTLRVECRYCYGPDWDVKPGKLVSRKGTWLKVSTSFSWELSDAQKLYLPSGIVVPVLQIGRVADPVELRRHDWANQHVRVWLKPSIVRTLEARRGTWFVYYPHFEERGLALVAQVDTWMKRTVQLSGELEPFEMMYIPKGLTIQLAAAVAPVEEEWEKHRHQHAHLHRKIVLASPPATIKQDKYDIFIGQGDDRLMPELLAYAHAK